MFLAGMRDNEWSGAYGPYQVTRYQRGVPCAWADIYYTMSTWNPYQSMLMHTRLTPADLVGS